MKLVCISISLLFSIHSAYGDGSAVADQPVKKKQPGVSCGEWMQIVGALQNSETESLWYGLSVSDSIFADMSPKSQAIYGQLPVQLAYKDLKTGQRANNSESFFGLVKTFAKSTPSGTLTRHDMRDALLISKAMEMGEVLPGSNFKVQTFNWVARIPRISRVQVDSLQADGKKTIRTLGIVSVLRGNGHLSDIDMMIYRRLIRSEIEQGNDVLIDRTFISNAEFNAFMDGFGELKQNIISRSFVVNMDHEISWPGVKQEKTKEVEED